MALYAWENAPRGETDGDLHGALVEIDAAMREGDTKYGKNAWKNGHATALDHALGAQRHLRRWFKGEKYDRDSQRRALAHVAARAIIALQREIDKDGRKHDQALTRGNGS